jgi:hypothetical protein
MEISTAGYYQNAGGRSDGALEKGKINTE